MTSVNPLDPYVARLIEVARAYYLENQTQAEIARELGISRSMVSRYLTAAREMGIVQIKIAAPEQTARPLEATLRGRYPHLKQVIIAPTFSEEPEAQRAMIGRFAANYLVEVVQNGERLTLGCGRTLRAMVDALPKPAESCVAVMQAMGNLGHEAHKIDYNEIARRAAEVLGGQAYYVSAPAILGIGSGLAADFVAANAGLYYSLGLAKKSDIFVVGLGSMEIDHTYVRVGLIQEYEWEELKALDAVGDICGRFFDVRGRELHSPFHDRIVGIGLDDLRHAAWSIVVAGGEDKVAPLLGAVRGGFVNVVVSDEATIQHLLEMDEDKR